MRGLSLVAASGGHTSSRRAGLSPPRPHLLRSTGSRGTGSVTVAHGPRLLCGMWDLPRPGLEPVSPALAGRLSTTAPPGKPGNVSFDFRLKRSLMFWGLWFSGEWLIVYYQKSTGDRNMYLASSSAEPLLLGGPQFDCFQGCRGVTKHPLCLWGCPCHPTPVNWFLSMEVF